MCRGHFRLALGPKRSHIAVTHLADATLLYLAFLVELGGHCLIAEYKVDFISFIINVQLICTCSHHPKYLACLTSSDGCPKFSRHGKYSCPGSNITYTCALNTSADAVITRWSGSALMSSTPDSTHPESKWNSSSIHLRIMWQSLCCDNQCYLNMLHAHLSSPFLLFKL